MNTAESIERLRKFVEVAAPDALLVIETKYGFRTSVGLSDIAAALERIKELEGEKHWPMCARCQERPATCLGEYESDTGNEEYACDECCGHGNEDGHCVRIIPDGT